MEGNICGLCSRGYLPGSKCDHGYPGVQPGADTEQAFWDAAVIAGAAAQQSVGIPQAPIQIIYDACNLADMLVVERRKRIAARAKGG